MNPFLVFTIAAKSTSTTSSTIQQVAGFLRHEIMVEARLIRHAEAELVALAGSEPSPEQRFVAAANAGQRRFTLGKCGSEAADGERT